MLNQRYASSSFSLKRLQIGERGVVSELGRVGDRSIQKLRSLGIHLGTSITVEQRFPRFLVSVSGDRVALSEDLIPAIFVRVVGNAN